MVCGVVALWGVVVKVTVDVNVNNIYSMFEIFTTAAPAAVIFDFMLTQKG